MTVSTAACSPLTQGEQLKEISESARLYALRELSRRAGVSFDFFRCWRTELRAESLIVRPMPDTLTEIHFPIFARTEKRIEDIVRKTWSREAPVECREHIPDFIVPFCRRDSVNAEALFVQEAPHLFRCTEDLLASLLFTLCRREESDSQERDIHGRFPASASIAARHGFLTRPIVDEYGLAFQQILLTFIPSWQPLTRTLRVKLSHDIDELGIPSRFKSAVGQTLRRAAPYASARDFLSLVSSVEPGYLHSVRTICQISLQRGLHSALYWKTSAPGPFDTGYDLEHPKIAPVIAWAKDKGIELGVHPGYETFRSRPALQEEVQRAQAAIGKELIGGRQHYLRWCPETWADWESCGLAYDSTAGFADQVGFRCGTCQPFLPWLWDQNRCADLMEIPLVVMDGTLVRYMKLNPQQSREVVRQLLKRCSLVGGVFTLVWHNTGLFEPYWKHYLPILDMLSGTMNYEWETELKELRKEQMELSRKAICVST